MASSFLDSVLALIVRTSTDLPPDVRVAMKVAMAQETTGTRSAQALSIIAQNIDQAADGEGASGAVQLNGIELLQGGRSPATLGSWIGIEVRDGAEVAIRRLATSP